MSHIFEVIFTVCGAFLCISSFMFYAVIMKLQGDTLYNYQAKRFAVLVSSGMIFIIVGLLIN